MCHADIGGVAPAIPSGLPPLGPGPGKVTGKISSIGTAEHNTARGKTGRDGTGTGRDGTGQGLDGMGQEGTGEDGKHGTGQAG